MPDTGKARIRVMRFTLIISAVLLCIKFAAWKLTHSNALLTDALESIVNVAAGAFALFSIWYAVQPRDEDHPYGHGKIEFLAAGFEGALILLAGGSILWRAIMGLIHPQPLHDADIGAYLAAAAGACNYALGTYLVRRGKRENSALMQASGKHLITDTVSSIGLVLGLIAISLTGKVWIDNVMALLFGGYIIWSGFQLVRDALRGLLDKADTDKLKQVVQILNEHRKPQWIDVHNLRVIKYGTQLHVDVHLTLPWYLSLEAAHDEVDAVGNLINSRMGEDVEFFIHADPCIHSSCAICTVENCVQRKEPFQRKVEWTLNAVLPDSKHSMATKV
ncbi:MAG: cation diffusion facilitator family transporter [Bacteroidia bacterium]|jgi:cation diffusion facilitator family transporter|nr:cation diffusion facilitator family transporter [Bacteroidia bacterium]